MVDAPGEACVCVFGDLVARRYARVYGKLVAQVVMVGACAEIDDDAVGRFKVDFKVGTHTSSTIGCVEFKDLCLGIEYIALRYAACESVVRVFDFATETQECG